MPHNDLHLYKICVCSFCPRSVIWRINNFIAVLCRRFNDVPISSICNLARIYPIQESAPKNSHAVEMVIFSSTRYWSFYLGACRLSATYAWDGLCRIRLVIWWFFGLLMFNDFSDVWALFWRLNYPLVSGNLYANLFFGLSLTVLLISNCWPVAAKNTSHANNCMAFVGFKIHASFTRQWHALLC